MGRGQQSESIGVALDMEGRGLVNRFDIDWSVSLLVKCHIICIRVTLR